MYSPSTSTFYHFLCTSQISVFSLKALLDSLIGATTHTSSQYSSPKKTSIDCVLDALAKISKTEVAVIADCCLGGPA